MRRSTSAAGLPAQCAAIGVLLVITVIVSFQGGVLYAHIRTEGFSFNNLTWVLTQDKKLQSLGEVPKHPSLNHGVPRRIGNQTYCRSTREGCGALEEGYVGSTRCREKDVWVQFGLPLPVRIYQLYHSVYNHWQMYDCTHRLYQGLAQTSNSLRPDHFDIDGTRHLPLLLNIGYQSNLCEYSGIFGLNAGGHIDRQAEPYIGFQSWKAKKKGFALSCEAETTLVKGAIDSLADNIDTFFYWSCPAWDDDLPRQFYEFCKLCHGEQCVSVYADAFSALLTSNSTEGLIDGVPPMPGNSSAWAYMSYFAMPKHRLQQYLDFAALFFAALDAKFYSALGDPSTCPISNWDPDSPETSYARRHCFCYLLERLVNIWAYHSGLRFVYIHPETGVAEEYHPIKERTMLPWFLDGSMQKSKVLLLRELAQTNGRGIYDQLTRRESAPESIREL